ncbi:ABC transporter permease subunit [Polyangium sorediatum]|uniref:ABC transporter permease subunit n=1 Tax=Polyangium sorediatum TaxID=889274 RepID=A0ABT6P2E9_9BACT|nr:ABC transporter permease subunit [Polyangium sorediatum]MDI1434738.1 ABC transporter permease subunit [Polyangium sorediatum]
MGTRVTRSLADVVVPKLLFLCALASVLATLVIAGLLAAEALGFVRTLGASGPAADARSGLASLLAGTVLATLVAVLVALPLGLAAAIYLSEFAGPRARRVLAPTLDGLASLPTVVLGYLAIALLTPSLGAHPVLLSGVALGAMILPYFAARSAHVISAVPQNLREGAYALGASKLATVNAIVLKSARGGIGAALLFAVARALGEVMILVIITGHTPQGGWDVWVLEASSHLARASLSVTIEGALALVALALAMAVPASIGAASWLEEYAPRGKRMSRVEKLARTLAAAPPIVYGLLGLAIFVRVLGSGQSTIAGAAMLALLLLPRMTTAFREALRAVPGSLREACLALGADRLRTLREVVLPAAMPDIWRGALRSLARAAVETAPLAWIGALSLSALPWKLFVAA